MRKKYGYHYTSLKNWGRIKREGLHPYAINRPELRRYDMSPVGIYTWTRKPSRKEHVGSIIFQVASKNTSSVVLLRYTYTKDDEYRTPVGDTVSLEHSGSITAYVAGTSIGGFQYHKYCPAKLLRHVVPPESIELVGVYNLEELLQ